MQLTAIQLNIAWENRDANFTKIRALLEKSPPQPGGLIALPEMFASGFSMNIPNISDDNAEDERFLGEIARRYGVYTVGGIVTRDATGAGQNEAVVAGPGGNIVTRYRKIHPFAKEAKHYRAGEEIVTFKAYDTENGFNVAPFVCYDLRFPEIFRIATQKGANLFVVIASWPSDRADHWTTLLKARSIENQSYVLGVNRCGNDPYLAYPGKSVIYDPRGQTLAEADATEQIISAHADINSLNQYREQLPFLKDIRFLPHV